MCFTNTNLCEYGKLYSLKLLIHINIINYNKNNYNLFYLRLLYVFI